jgi:yecA family protein
MNHPEIFPDYDDLQRALEDLESLNTASEIHGALCGLLVARGVEQDAWMRHLIAMADKVPGEVLQGELECLLQQLYGATVRQLDDPEFGFHLLLPRDDAVLGERAEALAKWCEGFVYALGLGGLAEGVLNDEDLKEFLANMTEISHATAEHEDDDNDEEEAYMELVEYVRMGVLLASTELQMAAERVRLH